MIDTGCPRCDNVRAFWRDFTRIKRRDGGTTWGSWYVCRNIDCACRFDGITASADGVLPAGVVAREKQEEQK